MPWPLVLQTSKMGTTSLRRWEALTILSDSLMITVGSGEMALAMSSCVFWSSSGEARSILVTTKKMGT